MFADAFWRHAKAFYIGPNGTPTGEADHYRPAIAALRRLYGTTAARKFGPKALKALRRAMTRAGATTIHGSAETLPAAAHQALVQREGTSCIER